MEKENKDGFIQNFNNMINEAIKKDETMFGDKIYYQGALSNLLNRDMFFDENGKFDNNFINKLCETIDNNGSLDDKRKEDLKKYFKFQAYSKAFDYITEKTKEDVKELEESKSTNSEEINKQISEKENILFDFYNFNEFDKEEDKLLFLASGLRVMSMAKPEYKEEYIKIIGENAKNANFVDIFSKSLQDIEKYSGNIINATSVFADIICLYAKNNIELIENIYKSVIDLEIKEKNGTKVKISTKIIDTIISYAHNGKIDKEILTTIIQTMYKTYKQDKELIDSLEKLYNGFKSNSASSELANNLLTIIDNINKQQNKNIKINTSNLQELENFNDFDKKYDFLKKNENIFFKSSITNIAINDYIKQLNNDKNKILFFIFAMNNYKPVLAKQTPVYYNDFKGLFNDIEFKEKFSEELSGFIKKSENNEIDNLKNNLCDCIARQIRVNSCSQGVTNLCNAIKNVPFTNKDGKQTNFLYDIINDGTMNKYLFSQIQQVSTNVNDVEKMIKSYVELIYNVYPNIDERNKVLKDFSAQLTKKYEDNLQEYQNIIDEKSKELEKQFYNDLTSKESTTITIQNIEKLEFKKLAFIINENGETEKKFSGQHTILDVELKTEDMESKGKFSIEIPNTKTPKLEDIKIYHYSKPKEDKPGIRTEIEFNDVRTENKFKEMIVDAICKRISIEIEESKSYDEKLNIAIDAIKTGKLVVQNIDNTINLSGTFGNSSMVISSSWKEKEEERPKNKDLGLSKSNG